MKILVLSNYYPPHHVGGYELGCQDIVNQLRLRGHAVKVLTSTFGNLNSVVESETYRRLELYQKDSHKRTSINATLETVSRELQNRRSFEKVCNDFRPDVLYIFNMRGISVALMLLAQQMEIPVCYFVSDPWLTKISKTDMWMKLWSENPRYPVKNLLVKLFTPIVKIAGLPTNLEQWDLSHTQFASRYLKELSLAEYQPVEQGRIIHWGIDLEKYNYQQKTISSVGKLLFVGQVNRRKGVHTAIEALKILSSRDLPVPVTMTIAGGTSEPGYLEYLKSLIINLDLESKVLFLGKIERNQISNVLQEHDILVFPSIWDEPFSITLLEGMACGLAVVGTSTGGSAEILKDEWNALVFQKEDASNCAERLFRLLSDSTLFETVRSNGRKTIENRFRLALMVDAIEEELYRAAPANPRV